MAKRDDDRASLTKVWNEAKEFNDKQRKEGAGGLPVRWSDILAAASRREKAKKKPFDERLPKYMRPFQKEVGGAFEEDDEED
jgi:hypothetical protein